MQYGKYYKKKIYEVDAINKNESDYIYVNNDTTYSLILGALNIGVWVFNRNK